MKIKKIIKYTIKSFFGLVIIIFLTWVIITAVKSKIYGSHKIEASKSNHLYKKFLIQNIQSEVSYISAYTKKNQYLEIYNYHDSTDIYMWYIYKQDINIKYIFVKKGFHGKNIKSYNRTYEEGMFGTAPIFCFYHLFQFEFKDSILIKYNESRNVISEIQTINYYMVNCYFGQLAIGSSYKNSEIMMEVLGKPKSNLALFPGKEKILIVLAVARDGFPPIRDNYLKEILKPSLFERGLN